jgi:hypothetical protein
VYDLTLNEAESPEHKKLVKGLIDYMTSEGFKPYCATCDGYKPCKPNSGHVADVKGQNDKELVAIGLAKTQNDLDNEKTNAQFKIFSNIKMNNGKSEELLCPFYIAIPRSCTNELKQNLTKLGLNSRTNIRIVYFEI